MNQAIRHSWVAAIAMFALIFGAISYVQVIGADGFEYERRNRQTLCRCGQSENKPFCNGAHAAVKFQDGQAELG